MQVILLSDFKDLLKINIEEQSLVMGTFDGLHKGHQMLFDIAKNTKHFDILSALTFDFSLKEFNKSEVLSSLDDKINLFKTLNIDYLFVVKVDNNFKNFAPEVFIKDILFKLNVKEIYCGKDLKFGKNRAGNVDTLKQYFEYVNVVEFLTDKDGNKISSSTIKTKIKDGKIEEANSDLNKIYSVKGSVIHGHGIGKTLEFPTINLELNDNYVLPKNGVYISKILVDNQVLYGLTNVGVCPTIQEDAKKHIETFILGFNKDIYGLEVEVFFIKKIRDEKAFASKEELVNEIKENIKTAKNFLKLT